MPELPEVETVRKQLEAEIVGAEIVSVEIRVPKIFEGVPENIYRDKVVKVERAGKYLFVHFASKKGLVIHLKMTGRLIIKPLDHLNIKPLDSNLSQSSLRTIRQPPESAAILFQAEEIASFHSQRRRVVSRYI